jgi:hypothetical protein
VDIAPGFTVDAGQVVRHEVRQRVNLDDIRRVYGDAIRKVNRLPEIDGRTVRELADLVEANIARGAAYFAAYEGDYQCLIHLKGATGGIAVSKAGSAVRVRIRDGVAQWDQRYDVVYRTRASYLRQSLVTPYGHEILFVGSGGIFEFPQVAAVSSGVHREVMTMVRPWTGSGPRRSPGKPGGLAVAKRFVKRMLGRSLPDLYDLQEWTVFQGRISKA